MEETTGERLSVPTDFTGPTLSGTGHKNLMPPSHFTSALQPPGSGQPSLCGVQPVAESWSAAAGPALSSPPAAWLALSRGQEEVLDLREENQRPMVLQGDTLRGRSASTDSNGRFVDRAGGGGRDRWVRLEAEGRVRVEVQRVEVERLRGQLEALKESEERQRGELRDKDLILHRQSAELQTLHCDLGKTQARLDQAKLELQQNIQQNQKLSSQLEILEKESEEEIRRLRNKEARSREEVQMLLREAERNSREEEEEATRRNLELTTQKENLQKSHQIELQQLAASHTAVLEAATHARDQHQNSLDAMATEMLQLQGHLEKVVSERDVLRNQLSQASQVLEGQATELQNLRGYIGELEPQRGQEERLAEIVQKLCREKEALEKTADLLTIRLKCVNEILTLQEQKLLHKSLSDPLLSSGGCEGLRVLRLWRERVFSLCLCLRTQELELKTERERNRSGEKTLQQEVKQEQLRNTLLQHSLDNRLAQLHLEEVAVQSLKEELATLGRENTELTTWKHQASTDLATVKDELQRFSAAFEARVADVNKSQEQLHVFSKRLTFAKRRVQTIQGLLARRSALQKVQHCSRQAAQEDHRVRRLQAELQLLGEEREELCEELRRTPELIDKALAQLRETFGCQLKEQQVELDQSRGALAEALSSQKEAQQREQEALARLEETEARLEEAQEQSQQALRAAEAHLSECEAEMEDQVNTASDPTTPPFSPLVMALPQHDRQVTQERQGRGRRDQQLWIDRSQKEIQDLQRRLKEMETDRNLLLASVQERGHVTEVRGARMASSLPRTTTNTSENLLSVLTDLKALSSSVVDGPDQEEEEEEGERE